MQGVWTYFEKGIGIYFAMHATPLCTSVGLPLAKHKACDDTALQSVETFSLLQKRAGAYSGFVFWQLHGRHNSFFETCA